MRSTSGVAESRIRILLADDHVEIRQGLRGLLSGFPDIEVVGEASNGREAIHLAAKLLPDVVIMDITMPGTNGLEATRVICADLPFIKVVIFSMDPGIAPRRAAQLAGAVDYICKSESTDALISAIRDCRQAQIPPKTPRAE